MKLAANLSWLYTEMPFVERLKACAEDGFKHAECMFPYEYPVHQLRKAADEADVSWVLINAPAGNWASGDRGLASSIERRDEFRKSIDVAVEYAQALNIQKVHVLAGVVNLDDPNSTARASACYAENMAWLADETACLEIQWLIEPINRLDIPGYLLAEQAQAHRLIQELDRHNLGVQLDLYHCQKQEGNSLEALARYLPTGRVKHLQIAGVPDRGEPGCGSLELHDDPRKALDYGQVFRQLRQLGYTGTIGCEYRPVAATRDGLGWIQSTGFSGTMESF